MHLVTQPLRLILLYFYVSNSMLLPVVLLLELVLLLQYFSSLILMFGTAGSNSLERGNLSAYVIDPGICCMGMQEVDE